MQNILWLATHREYETEQVAEKQLGTTVWASMFEGTQPLKWTVEINLALGTEADLIFYIVVHGGPRVRQPAPPARLRKEILMVSLLRLIPSMH